MRNKTALILLLVAICLIPTCSALVWQSWQANPEKFALNTEPWRESVRNIIPGIANGLQGLASKLFNNPDNWIIGWIENPGNQFFLALLSLACIPLLLGLVMYAFEIRAKARKTSLRLKGDAINCCVCGTRQNIEHLERCTNCGQYYCNYPLQQFPSARENVDKQVAIGAGCAFVLITSFTIVGGVIVLALLAIPYMVLRQFIPDSNQAPPHWKQCGGRTYDLTTNGYLGGRCKNCGQEESIPSTPIYSMPESSSNAFPSSTLYDDDSSSSYVRDSSSIDYTGYSPDDWNDRSDDREDDDERDNDDKDHDPIWGGWLFK